MNFYFPSPRCSFTTLFSQGIIKKIIITEIMAKAVLVKKKNSFRSNTFHKPDKTPESLFPMAVDKNQPPIIKAAIRFGLSFDTNDNPIGLKNSSPTVITP